MDENNQKMRQFDICFAHNGSSFCPLPVAMAAVLLLWCAALVARATILIHDATF